MSDSAAVDAAEQHSQKQGRNLPVCANAARYQPTLVLQSAAAAAAVLPPLPVVRGKQSQVLQMAAAHWDSVQQLAPAAHAHTFTFSVS